MAPDELERWKEAGRVALQIVEDHVARALKIGGAEGDAYCALIEAFAARLLAMTTAYRCRSDHGAAGEGAIQNRPGAQLDDGGSIFADLEDRSPLPDTPEAAPPDRAFGESTRRQPDDPGVDEGEGDIVNSDGSSEKP